MEMRLTYCIFFLACLFGGCASYQAVPLDPSADLKQLMARSPAVVLVSGPATASATAPFDLSDGFDECEVIAIALRLNTELAAVRSSAGEANALLIESGLFPNPELGVSYQPGINKTESFNADIDLMIELLRLGETQAMHKTAQATADEIKAKIIAYEYDLVTQVRRQFVTVLATEAELGLLKEEVQLRQQATQLVKHRQASGEANALDVVAAELELADLERDYRRTSIQVPQERARLNRLLGLPATYSLQLADAGKAVEVRLIDVPDLQSLRTATLTGRLDLKHQKMQYNRAENELQLEVLRQYPSLKLGPAFSHEGPSENYMGLAVAMEVPLLKRNKGEVAAKLAQRDRIRAEYIDLLHKLVGEADASAKLVATLRQEVETQRTSILPLLERSTRLYRQALDAGEMNVIDYLTIEQRLLQSRRDNLRTLIEYRLAWIDLDASTGMTLSGLRPILTLSESSTSSSQ